MSKSTLLQEYNYPSNYTYPNASMALMGHFFEEVKKCKDHIIFQDYQPEVMYAQYSHLVIANRLQLKQVKSRKKQWQWRLSIDDHDAILENFPLAHFIWVEHLFQDEQWTLILGLEHTISTMHWTLYSLRLYCGLLSNKWRCG